MSDTLRWTHSADPEVGRYGLTATAIRSLPRLANTGESMAAYQCPTCKKITRAPGREALPYRPFCSRRCQLIDLNHWFEGDYRISDPLSPEADGIEADDLADGDL